MVNKFLKFDKNKKELLLILAISRYNFMWLNFS